MLDQLKIKNLTNILVCLFTKHYATKAELAQATGLSNSTISSSVNRLSALRLMEEAGVEESMGGRRSTIYRLNKSYGQFVGVDLSEKGIRYVITDCQNNILYSDKKEYIERMATIEQLLNVLNEALSKWPNVLGIGIGLNGSIDYKEQVVRASQVPKWKDVHLKEIIERQFLVLTYLDHRINGAGVREGILGVAVGQENYAFICETAPEKMALVLGGKICRGKNNRTGRILSQDDFWRHFAEFSVLLDLDAVYIGYHTLEYKEKVLEAARDCRFPIICFPETDDCIPVGMAAVTQKEWFQSIYFML